MPDACRHGDPAGDPRAGPAAAPRLDVGRVCIVFTRIGDRWAHRVLVDGAARFLSTEGPTTAGDDRWPASPVLTEVSLVAAGGGTAVVGVGRAGRSHFSLSATRHPALPDAIVVEAACRIHEPPGWLGSTYEPFDQRLADGPATAASPSTEEDGDMVRLSAPSGATAPAPLPRTVTWSYVISPAGIAAQPPVAGPVDVPAR
jgi:hypothetical protein